MTLLNHPPLLVRYALFIPETAGIKMTMLRFFVLFVVYMWCIMFVGAVQKGQTLFARHFQNRLSI